MSIIGWFAKRLGYEKIHETKFDYAKLFANMSLGDLSLSARNTQSPAPEEPKKHRCGRRPNRKCWTKMRSSEDVVRALERSGRAWIGDSMTIQRTGEMYILCALYDTDPGKSKSLVVYKNESLWAVYEIARIMHTIIFHARYPGERRARKSALAMEMKKCQYSIISKAGKELELHG